MFDGFFFGETVATAKAVSEQSEGVILPVAVNAAVLPVQVFEVGASHKPIGTALGTGDEPLALEVADEAYVCARIMMDESMLHRTRRLAPPAGSPKGRQALTFGTKLNPVADDAR